jgi:glycosyltransferase involved in cell wall biosynthesis
LDAYSRSTWKDFEVIVADDGSEEETAEEVRSFSRRSPFPVLHVRQQHEGFRLGQVRNLAARAASGDIFFFSDGDCLPFPGALEAHAESCVPGLAVAGSRSLLGPEETRRLLEGPAAPAGLLEAVWRRDASRLVLRYWRSLFESCVLRKARPKLCTANAAVHRQDFEGVNGFDERFQGWGYEDDDLARRLRRLGVRILDATLRSRVVHLFHPVHESHRPSARAGANYRYFKTGKFLTRPLRGLRPRSASELSLELIGDVPPHLGQLGREPSAGGRPEVTVVFGSSAVRPRGEIVVRLPAGARITTSEELYQLVGGIS